MRKIFMEVQKVLHNLPKYFSDRILNQQICVIVPGRRRFVDDYEFVAPEIVNEPGSRINSQRGTADDEYLGILYITNG